MSKTVVIALGGNAILQPGQKGSMAEQQANIAVACGAITQVLAAGHRVILTHGNGPQVGNILLQQEEARSVVPPAPLDVCGAQSQGLIGYLFQQELQRQTGRPAVALVTQVVIDPDDPAFARPSKPVGPFYTPAMAARLQREQGWAMKEDAGRGWRRVVPSPLPLRVVEVDAIRRQVEAGALVIAAGGGGVPVSSDLAGVEAVIDKDQTAAVLARELGADLLVILTDVPAAAIHYGRSEQQALGRVGLAEAERYYEDGHFKSGSMGPKVAAAIRFVRGGGERAAIAALGAALGAVDGTAGTQVVPG